MQKNFLKLISIRNFYFYYIFFLF